MKDWKGMKKLNSEEISDAIVEFMVSAAVAKALTDQQRGVLFDAIKLTLKTGYDGLVEVDQDQSNGHLERFKKMVDAFVKPHD